MARSDKGEPSSLNMLHNSVIDMRNSLSASFSEGLNALRDSSEEVQQRTSGQIVSEVGKLRSELTTTRNRVTTIDSQTRDTEEQVARLHAQMNLLLSAVADVAENVGQLRAAQQPAGEEVAPAPDAAGGSAENGHVTSPDRENPAASEHVDGESSAPVGVSKAEERRSETEEVREGTADAGSGGGGGDEGGAGNGDRDGYGSNHAEHAALMLQAAGISSANLICNRDVWQFLVGFVLRHEHFCLPSEISDNGQGRVKAVLSGRTIIAVLITLREVRIAHAKHCDGSWALASRVYERFQEGLYRASPAGRSPLTIVLDDGVTVTDEQEET